MEDLAKQKEIKYGVLNGGSLYAFFKQSQVGIYQTMFQTMKTGNTFVNSTKEGVEKVRQGGFAYLTDGPYLDYYNSRNPCNTMMLENLLEAKSYGIALQRNSELTNPFSVAILKVSLPYELYRYPVPSFATRAAKWRYLIFASRIPAM